MPEVNETEVYHRLNRLEQEIHTLKYRTDELNSHNLPIRVANLEPAVKNISADVAKIEANTDKLTNVVTSMRSWGTGFSIALSVFVVLINLFPIFKGWLS